ncbi:MAG: DUF2236 domain-containing protein [Myxococcales bacterium]|nr:DUF2236 domain-containing protein [Myxococcales bacterium]
MLRAAQRATAVVDAAALEDGLRGLDDAPTLFPLDSALARVGREAGLLLYGPRAALLQIAHPFIAQAVADHSRVLADMQSRFRRTMSLMYRLTFAPPAEAFAIARALHARHDAVEGTLTAGSLRLPAGTHYRANEVEPLYWVAATLWDTSLLFHEQVLVPLTPAEKDAYLADTRRFGRLFGIPEATQPPSWAAFQDYMDRMLRGEVLGVTSVSRQLAQAILTPPRRAAAPFFRWARAFGAGLLPPTLRDAFGLPFGVAERALHGASLRALRAIVPRLPASVRFAPAWHAARARAGLAPPPGPATRLAPRVALWLTAGRAPVSPRPPAG